MRWNMNAGRLGPDELRELMRRTKESDYVLVDVRQPGEYRDGHIPGAKLMPLPTLEARLGEWDPDKEHILYCRSGARSRTAARLVLDALPQAKVRDLAGGILAWDGRSVSDMPHVAVFEGLSDPATMLIAAMDLEKAAHDLYHDLLDAVDDAAVRSLMKKLGGLELAHAKLLYRRLRDISGAEPLQDFATMFAALPGEVLEGGLSVRTLGPWIASAKAGGCMAFAELALEIELHALDLYRAMAHDAGDEEAERLFLDLAQQEKQHARLIVDSLDSFAAAG